MSDGGDSIDKLHKEQVSEYNNQNVDIFNITDKCSVKDASLYKYYINKIKKTTTKNTESCKTGTSFHMNFKEDNLNSFANLEDTYKETYKLGIDFPQLLISQKKIIDIKKPDLKKTPSPSNRKLKI